MKEQWLKLAARYDVLQMRERWLIVTAVLGGIVLVGFSLLVDPAMKRAQVAERNSAEYRTQLSAIQSQMAALQSPERDPDAAARVELSSLRKQLGDLAGRLAIMENSLVPPQSMPGLLEDMIGRKTGLRLISLKTLPLAPLLDKKPAADETATPRAVDKLASSSAGLFKHGVEIRLEGSYQELAAYLERLEKAKLKLLWSSVSLSADRHPKLVLTLTVFTLSLDRAWLIV